MIFSLFGKKSSKYIEESIKKYSAILEADLDLMVRISYDNKTYTTYVEALNNREVVFRCPTDGQKIIRFDSVKSIKLDFISYTGLYTTDINITERLIKDNNIYYKGEISSPIQKKQRRDNFRLPIYLDFSYTLSSIESRVHSANTKNISVGGMLMESENYLYENKKIKITFKLDDKVYRLKSTIINKRTNFVNGKYLYHVRFDDLSSRQEKEIYRFILEKQKIALKRNAGLS